MYGIPIAATIVVFKRVSQKITVSYDRKEPCKLARTTLEATIQVTIDPCSPHGDGSPSPKQPNALTNDGGAILGPLIAKIFWYWSFQTLWGFSAEVGCPAGCRCVLGCPTIRRMPKMINQRHHGGRAHGGKKIKLSSEAQCEDTTSFLQQFPSQVTYDDAAPSVIVQLVPHDFPTAILVAPRWGPLKLHGKYGLNSEKLSTNIKHF